MPKTPSFRITNSHDDSGKCGANTTCSLLLVLVLIVTPSSPEPSTTSSLLDKKILVFTQFAHEIPSAGATLRPDDHSPGAAEPPPSAPTTSTTWLVTTAAAPKRRARDLSMEATSKRREVRRAMAIGVGSNSERKSEARESTTRRRKRGARERRERRWEGE